MGRDRRTAATRNDIMYEGMTTGYHTDPKHNGTGWLDRFKLAGNAATTT